MLTFIIFCDLNTLSCTADDIARELEIFATSYYRVNDSFWLFRYPDGFMGDFANPEVYLFDDHFAKFVIDDNSIFYISLATKQCFGELPDPAWEYYLAYEKKLL